MKRPDNINDALRHLHNLTMSIAMDLRRYMDDDQMQYDAESVSYTHLTLPTKRIV